MCYIDPPCCLLSNTPKVSKGNKIREITTIRIRNIQIIKILSKSSIIHIHKRRKRPKKCGKLILFYINSLRFTWFCSPCGTQHLWKLSALFSYLHSFRREPGLEVTPPRKNLFWWKPPSCILPLYSNWRRSRFVFSSFSSSASPWGKMGKRRVVSEFRSNHCCQLC